MVLNEKEIMKTCLERKELISKTSNVTFWPNEWASKHLGSTSYTLWIKWCLGNGVQFRSRTLSCQRQVKLRKGLWLLIRCKQTNKIHKIVPNYSFSSTDEWLAAVISTVIVYTFHFQLMRHCCARLEEGEIILYYLYYLLKVIWDLRCF